MLTTRLYCRHFLSAWIYMYELPLTRNIHLTRGNSYKRKFGIQLSIFTIFYLFLRFISRVRTLGIFCFHCSLISFAIYWRLLIFQNFRKQSSTRYNFASSLIKVAWLETEKFLHLRYYVLNDYYRPIIRNIFTRMIWCALEFTALNTGNKSGQPPSGKRHVSIIGKKVDHLKSTLKNTRKLS